MLSLCGMPQLSAAAVAALLSGLVGHRSLEALTVSLTPLEDPAAVGAALAALVAADALALVELDVSNCHLREAGLGALLDALPRNTHLRELEIRGNDPPAGFMRARLLPAVRANTGLRRLLTTQPFLDPADDNLLAMQEAQRIVAAR